MKTAGFHFSGTRDESVVLKQIYESVHSILGGGGVLINAISS